MIERHLPRRPARRQPARAARRPHRRCSTTASSARLSHERRLAFLRLMVGATTNDLMGQMAALRDLGALPRDTDLDGGDPRPRPRPAAGRPDHADRRRDGQGGAAGRQGAARLRRPDAQGADAVRQEHGVPRRRHRPPGARPRHPRRDRQRSRCCSPSATATSSAASSASTRTASSSTSTASRPASALDPDVERLTHRELQARRA